LESYGTYNSINPRTVSFANVINSHSVAGRELVPLSLEQVQCIGDVCLSWLLREIILTVCRLTNDGCVMMKLTGRKTVTPQWYGVLTE